MRTIELTPGMTIKEAAIRLRSAAPARASFNGIDIAATGGETEGDIVAAYYAASEARTAAWEASDEGKASRAREERARAEAQRSVDAALRILPTIDWSDHAAPLTWLCEAQPSMDRAGVTFDRAAVVALFRAHGYEANVYCGAAFDPKSRDIFARWVIGQALDGIATVGAPHQVIERFARDWRETFPPPVRAA